MLLASVAAAPRVAAAVAVLVATTGVVGARVVEAVEAVVERHRSDRSVRRGFVLAVTSVRAAFTHLGSDLVIQRQRRMDVLLVLHVLQMQRSERRSVRVRVDHTVGKRRTTPIWIRGGCSDDHTANAREVFCEGLKSRSSKYL
jgi:hypothetical protein